MRSETASKRGASTCCLAGAPSRRNGDRDLALLHRYLRSATNITQRLTHFLWAYSAPP